MSDHEIIVVILDIVEIHQSSLQLACASELEAGVNKCFAASI